jgi:hypothetical protein
MDDEKIAELRALLEGLEACETAPEQGPYYLHDLIQRPATLIEFLRLHLPPVGS